MLTTFEHQGQPVTMHGFEPDHLFRTIRDSSSFYEPDLLACMSSLEPTGTVIDVGANIGNHSVYLGLFTDVDHVVAVEPYPLASEFLENNIAANYLGAVVTHEACALGASNGTVGLRPGSNRNIGHTRVVEGTDVELRRLDDLVEDEKVSIIKIDVEGYEMEVLKGATETISSQLPYLFIEASNRARRRRISKFLAPYGYQIGGVFNGQPTYFYHSSNARTGVAPYRLS